MNVHPGLNDETQRGAFCFGIFVRSEFWSCSEIVAAPGDESSAGRDAENGGVGEAHSIGMVYNCVGMQRDPAAGPDRTGVGEQSDAG